MKIRTRNTKSEQILTEHHDLGLVDNAKRKIGYKITVRIEFYEARPENFNGDKWLYSSTMPAGIWFSTHTQPTRNEEDYGPSSITRRSTTAIEAYDVGKERMERATKYYKRKFSKFNQEN